MMVLGIDTCGPTGTVALARVGDDGSVETLEQLELAGRSYSATLVTAVGELLEAAQLRLGQLDAMVVVSGPGSFTGVRVGLSAVKGFAEPAGTPVVAVSRLAVLARAARLNSAALDAHRSEMFVRVGEREWLSGAAELAAAKEWPRKVAVCEDAAEALLAKAWPMAELVRVATPTATGAIELAIPWIKDGHFADIAVLDGHYLRRSDAEIFGDKAEATA